MIMGKISIIFQILTKSIFKPKLVKDVFEERRQSQENEDHKNHKYIYDFDSIEDFFKNIFPTKEVNEKELEELELHVKQNLKKLKNEKYPSKKKPYPTDYSINSDSRKFLYCLCRILKPKNVIETGVAYGISSSYILQALKDNEFGKLYSIDSIFRPWQTEEMIGSIIPKKLKNNWELIIGKSTEKLESISNEVNDLDIFIHDSSHTYENMMFEFNMIIKKIKKNGVIISDDIIDNDAFYDFTSANNVKKYVVKVEGNQGLGIIIKN
jgi:predicted O-methyltransferase YrrM